MDFVLNSIMFFGNSGLPLSVVMLSIRDDGYFKFYFLSLYVVMLYIRDDGYFVFLVSVCCDVVYKG